MASPQPTGLAYRIRRIDQQQEHHQHPKTNSIRWFKFIFTAILRTRSTHWNSLWNSYPSPLTTLTCIPINQSPQYIGCERFFREGQDFLRTNLSNPYLGREYLDIFIARAMYEVQQIFDGSEKPSDSYVLPLSVDIIIDALVDNEFESESESESEVIEESMQQAATVIPASGEAIHSLKKLKLTKQCMICMEDFDLDDGVEVSAMPCAHVFHQQCIVSWLETSHTCPLCRYPMPTANIPFFT